LKTLCVHGILIECVITLLETSAPHATFYQRCTKRITGLESKVLKALEVWANVTTFKTYPKGQSYEVDYISAESCENRHPTK
jgi:hypothetical protein